MSEEVGKHTSFSNQFSESIICVRRNHISVCINVLRNVAVIVVAWDIELLSGGVRSGGVGDSEI